MLQSIKSLGIKLFLFFVHLISSEFDSNISLF